MYILIYIYIYIYICFIESNAIFNVYNFFVELFDVANFIF